MMNDFNFANIKHSHGHQPLQPTFIAVSQIARFFVDLFQIFHYMLKEAKRLLSSYRVCEKSNVD